MCRLLFKIPSCGQSLFNATIGQLFKHHLVPFALNVLPAMNTLHRLLMLLVELLRRALAPDSGPRDEDWLG